MSSDIVSKRLFVGGLADDVSERDIVERFARFGNVSDLSLKHRKDEAGVPQKSFAHLNIESDEASIKKCFAAYQNAKWKGSVLKLQYAKESFLNRLVKERQEVPEPEPPAPTLSPGTWQPPQIDKLQGPAVPGTPIPGKKDWVVGKYGRVLPTLKLKKSSMLKIVKHDPSKLCHTAKVFKDSVTELPHRSPPASLTWEIDTPDSEIVKKMKGQFPPSKKQGQKPVQVLPKLAPSQAARGDDSLVNGSVRQKYVPKEEDLEIVPINKNSPKQNSSQQQTSNRFDSDVDSDSEQMSPASLSPHKSTTPGKLNKSRNSDKKINKSVSDSSAELKEKPVFGNRERESRELEESLAASSPVLGSKDETSFMDLESESVGNKEQLNGSTWRELSQFDASDSQQDSFRRNNFKNKKKKKRKRGGEDDDSDDEECPLPKFGGLSMLRSPPRDEKQDQETAAVSPLAPEVPRKVQKLTPSVKEDAKVLNDFKRSSRPTDPPKVKAKASVEMDYDSASSADTEEIIRSRKSRTSADANSSPALPSEAWSSKKSPRKGTPMSSSGLSSATPDQKLLLSELVAGAPEVAGAGSEVKAASTSAPGAYDSYDSDLDSNDFALVARKLVEKAAGKTSSKDAGRKNATSKMAASPKVAPPPPAGDPGKRQLTSEVDGDMEEGSSGRKRIKCEESPRDKKLTDNEKRLQAVKERMKVKQQQQLIMQEALLNVDSKENKKRKVFSSEEEEEEEEDTPAESRKEAQKAGGASGKEATTDLKLFDTSSEDSGEESDYADMFKSRPHLEGKKGETLMKLERRIGDSRFKLDAKFADSDSEDEGVGEPERDESNDQADELAAERDANLKVLEQVVGKATLDQFTQKIKRNTKHIVDMNSVRFDPTKVSTPNPPTDRAERRKVPTSTVHVEHDMNERRFDPTTFSGPSVHRGTDVTPQKLRTRDAASCETSPAASQTSQSHKGEQLKHKQLNEEGSGHSSSSDDNDEEEEKDTGKVDSSKKSLPGPATKAKKTKSKKVKVTEKPSGVETSAKSKAVLSSSLLNLFKKKDDSEEGGTGGFSLLDQFDRSGPDVRSGVVKAGEKGRASSQGATAPLSGLLRPPATGSAVSSSATGGTTVTEESSDDSGDEEDDDSSDESGNVVETKDDEDSDEEDDDDESDSDDADLSKDDDRGPSSQTRPSTFDLLSKKDESDGESGEDDEEVEPMADDEAGMECDDGIGAELKNAGGVDVRFNKDKWMERWNEIRPVLVKMYKKKHKDAVKSRRAQSEMKRRKEFSKNAKKNAWFRRKR